MTTLGVLFFGYVLLLALALGGFRAFSGRHFISDEDNRGAHAWTLAFALLITGWSLLALRWSLHNPWLEVPGGGLLMAGFTGMAGAMATEAGAHRRAWTLHWPAVLVAALTAAGLWLDWRAQDRLLVFWICAALATAVSLPALRVLVRSETVWPDRTMALLFWVGGPVVLWRLIEQALAPSTGLQLATTPSLAQAAALVYFPALPILAGFGFVQMRHRRRSRHMRYLATHDSLTGLGNRDSFTQFGVRTVLDSPQGSARMAAMMIDIDHFKAVNDRHGHAVGDAALQQVGTIIRGVVRDVDFAARLGGDEFAVLLVGAQPGTAGEVAARIRMRLAEVPFQVDAVAIALTLSIGIAETAGGHESLDALMHRADRQLYAAKEGGRNQVAVDALASPAAA